MVDDLVLYGAIVITVLFLVLLLLAAGVACGIAWIAAALLAGRSDLVITAVAATGVILSGYWLAGQVLAWQGIL